LAEFRERHALQEYRALRRLARRAGYHLVMATYYSPIPDLDELGPGVWTDPDDMPGVGWDLDAQLAFLERDLGPYLLELDAPSDPPGNAEGYHLENEFFNALDAEVLHAIVRRFRPARLLEVGSGFSTLIIAGAGARNEADDVRLRHSVYDPFPSPVLHRIRDRIDLHPVPATEIPDQRFDELEAGDVLFIDSTHTVRPGGDVARLVLGVLPRLSSGVVVHMHDIFRPFEYPRVLLDDYGSYWQEHHLLQAFLAFNDEFEVLCANHALSRLRHERVSALVPSLRPGMLPSSIWMRRRG
jgi:hypothetical protein